MAQTIPNASVGPRSVLAQALAGPGPGRRARPRPRPCPPGSFQQTRSTADSLCGLPKWWRAGADLSHQQLLWTKTTTKSKCWCVCVGGWRGGVTGGAVGGRRGAAPSLVPRHLTLPSAGAVSTGAGDTSSPGHCHGDGECLPPPRPPLLPPPVLTNPCLTVAFSMSTATSSPASSSSLPPPPSSLAHSLLHCTCSLDWPGHQPLWQSLSGILMLPAICHSKYQRDQLQNKNNGTCA